MIDMWIAYLNTKTSNETLPEEARDIYDEEKYLTSQKYEKTKYQFSKISSTLSFFVTLFVLLF
jgi:hypothetical protein